MLSSSLLASCQNGKKPQVIWGRCIFCLWIQQSQQRLFSAWHATFVECDLGKMFNTIASLNHLCSCGTLARCNTASLVQNIGLIFLFLPVDDTLQFSDALLGTAASQIK